MEEKMQKQKDQLMEEFKQLEMGANGNNEIWEKIKMLGYFENQDEGEKLVIELLTEPKEKKLPN
jgi:hypothetical protein